MPVSYRTRMESTEVTRNTLLDLGSQSNSLTQMIASMEGEITDELFDQIFSLNEATEAKIEGYAWTMDRLEYEAHFWKERAAIYSRIIKNLEKTREKMRERLKMFIELTGKPAQGVDSEFRLVETGSHRVRLRIKKLPHLHLLFEPVSNQFVLIKVHERVLSVFQLVLIKPTKRF